jgi:hypothetical protein
MLASFSPPPMSPAMIDPTSPSAAPLLFRPGIEESQQLGPDRSSPSAHPVTASARAWCYPLGLEPLASRSSVAALASKSFASRRSASPTAGALSARSRSPAAFSRRNLISSSIIVIKNAGPRLWFLMPQTRLLSEPTSVYIIYYLLHRSGYTNPLMPLALDRWELIVGRTV